MSHMPLLPLGTPHHRRLPLHRRLRSRRRLLLLHRLLLPHLHRARLCPQRWRTPRKSTLRRARRPQGTAAGLLHRRRWTRTGLAESLPRHGSRTVRTTAWGTADPSCRPVQVSKKPELLQPPSARLFSRKPLWPHDRLLAPPCAVSPSKVHTRVPGLRLGFLQTQPVRRHPWLLQRQWRHWWLWLSSNRSNRSSRSSRSMFGAVAAAKLNTMYFRRLLRRHLPVMNPGVNTFWRLRRSRRQRWPLCRLFTAAALQCGAHVPAPLTLTPVKKAWRHPGRYGRNRPLPLKRRTAPPLPQNLASIAARTCCRRTAHRDSGANATAGAGSTDTAAVTTRRRWR